MEIRDRIKRLLDKIDFGSIVFGIVLIVVIVAAVTFVSALVAGELSKFPAGFLKTIGFLLLGPVLIVIIAFPILTVWYAVEILTMKVQLSLENADWVKQRPSRVKAMNFVLWTLAMVLCLVSGSILLGIAQSSRDGWLDFLIGVLAIILIFVGLQIFALRGFNPFVAQIVTRLWDKFRSKGN